MITGCTLGKGDIQKLHYGKWGLTLVEVATGRAVRVTPKAEAMLANKQTSFFKDYREKGIPASKVPLEVVQPLVDRVMGAPAEQLLNVGSVFDHPVERHRALLRRAGVRGLRRDGRRRLCAPGRR